MRMRLLLFAAPALVAAVLMAGTPAAASAAGQAGPSRAGSPAPAARPGVPGVPASGPSARPARSLMDNVLNGVSCTSQPDNPSIISTCAALGFWVDGPYVQGLEEWSTNGTWDSNIFGGLRAVTDPLQVSCFAQQSTNAACVAVGETYSNFRRPLQFVENGDGSGYSTVTVGNPRGATWSLLDDVSCASTTFCVLVGSAGRTRGSGRHLRYLSHANAYRWDGTALHRLRVPAPPHARFSVLSSVSCPAPASCMVAGSYAGAHGGWRPYSALWNNGAWSVHVLRAVRGKAHTIVQAVSCSAPGSCVAVGDATKPGSTAFAERYANGAWRVQRVVAGSRSAFFSVSCPTSSYCAAVGTHGRRALIQAWNGTGWAGQGAPRTAAPFTSDALLHISCMTPAICTAVGARHNPKTRYSNKSLALGWNGKSWVIQTTVNQ